VEAFDEPLHLAVVKPQAATTGAAVDLEAHRLADFHYIKPAETARTPPARAAPAVGLQQSLGERTGRNTGEIGDELQLAVVKPCSMTRNTTVDLDPLQLKSDHGLLADWAHSCSVGTG